jgi:hypothetical protein
VLVASARVELAGPRRSSPAARSAKGEHGFGVASGMDAERKVKVLLEPRQTESNTESRGYPVREVRWKP